MATSLNIHQLKPTTDFPSSCIFPVNHHSRAEHSPDKAIDIILLSLYKYCRKSTSVQILQLPCRHRSQHTPDCWHRRQSLHQSLLLPPQSQKRKTKHSNHLQRHRPNIQCPKPVRKHLGARRPSKTVLTAGTGYSPGCVEWMSKAFQKADDAIHKTKMDMTWAELTERWEKRMFFKEISSGWSRLCCWCSMSLCMRERFEGECFAFALSQLSHSKCRRSKVYQWPVTVGPTNPT